jgi:glutamine phosphoribosylpyrophosphate amidotransferase
MAGHGITKDDVRALDDLMWISALRGNDATGLLSLNHNSNNDANLYKINGDVFYWRTMVNEKKKIVDKLYNPWNTVFIGHNRFATQGSLGNDGSQPFRYPSVLGVHNGGIDWGKDGIEGYSSDSDRFYYELDKNKGSIEDTLKLINNKKDALALVWYDVKKRTLNFYRNEKRDLFFAVSKKADVMFWASESGMLDLALSRQRPAIDYDCYWFSADTHYSVNPGQISRSKKDGSFFTVRKIVMAQKNTVIAPPDNTHWEDWMREEGVIADGSGLGASKSELDEIPWLRDTREKKVMVN